MSTGNFLQDFELSMNKLEEAKKNIQQSIDDRQQFTETLKLSLTEINKKLGELVGDISKLKQTVDNLQSNVNNNNNSIADKQKQIDVLTQQLTMSKQECDTSINQVNQEKQQLQSSIDSCEANLRAITAEKDALKTELQNKGDLAGQHANTIEKMAKDAELLAQQKAAEFQQREKDLNDRIAAFEAQIQELEKQISEKDIEINKIKNEHETVQGNANNNLTSLQTQIDKLKEENGHLTERLIQATQAINNAIDILNAITESAPNAKSQKEISALLRQIEQTIENIGRAIQGQQAAAPQHHNQPHLQLYCQLIHRLLYKEKLLH